MRQHQQPLIIALKILIPIIIGCMLPGMLWAGDITLAWDPNTESNLAGYKLYYDSDTDTEMYQGTGANEGDSPIVIYTDDLADPDAPQITLTGLSDGQYYYFALTAFDTDEMESDFSDEVGTLVGYEDTTSKAVDNTSETPSVSSEASDTSSGSGSSGCFISDATGNTTESLPMVMAVVFLILAAAVTAHFGPPLKRVRTHFQRHAPKRKPAIRL